MIAESYERIHRSNLVGMGIIPFQYLDGQTAASLALTGRESLTIDLPQNLQPGQNVDVKVSPGGTVLIKLFESEIKFTLKLQIGQILAVSKSDLSRA